MNCLVLFEWAANHLFHYKAMLSFVISHSVQSVITAITVGNLDHNISLRICDLPPNGRICAIPNFGSMNFISITRRAMRLAVYAAIGCAIRNIHFTSLAFPPKFFMPAYITVLTWTCDFFITFDTYSHFRHKVIITWL